MFAFAPILMAIAVIPFGPDVTVFGHRVMLQIADLNMGILYFFAVTGMSVYGVVLAGWSSGSKYPLLGGLRSASQMISYEVARGLSLVGIFMVFESVRLSHIVQEQGELLFGVLPAWGVFLQPVGFILFLTAQFAEANRTPFDLPEGESELVAGYHTEYGSFKFSMFMMGEYLHMVITSVVVATLFFGGWQFPYLYDTGFLFPGGLALSLPWYRGPADADRVDLPEVAVLHLALRVGPLDDPAVPVRPGHAAGVEGDAPRWGWPTFSSPGWSCSWWTGRGKARATWRSA